MHALIFLPTKPFAVKKQADYPFKTRERVQTVEPSHMTINSNWSLRCNHQPSTFLILSALGNVIIACCTRIPDPHENPVEHERGLLGRLVSGLPLRSARNLPSPAIYLRFLVFTKFLFCPIYSIFILCWLSLPDFDPLWHFWTVTRLNSGWTWACVRHWQPVSFFQLFKFVSVCRCGTKRINHKAKALLRCPGGRRSSGCPVSPI